MSSYVIGLDIGGTKCSVVLSDTSFIGDIDRMIIDKIGFETEQPKGVSFVLNNIFSAIGEIIKRNNLNTNDILCLGISCGGPLSSVEGIIKSPPNLPDWDNINIVKMIEERFGIKAYLQNDANACAVAEWKFGAGRGYRNIVFLTFGTGMGAGLILDRRLYSGTNDNAGEVGHIRIENDGPVGYGKHGSFEGFCSGGGIARLAQNIVSEKLKNGQTIAFCKSIDEIETITAKSVAAAAKDGDTTAIEIYRICGEKLGKGLSLIVDILNPEVIILGSIYERSGELLVDSMNAVLKQEALPLSLGCCVIKPAELKNSIGDFAAIGVAVNGAENDGLL